MTTEPCPTCGAPRPVVDPASLRAIRLAAGLSLREVSRRLRISPSYLSDIERGTRACPEVVRVSYERLGPLPVPEKPEE